MAIESVLQKFYSFFKHKARSPLKQSAPVKWNEELRSIARLCNHGDFKPVYLDVGARGGLEEPWSELVLTSFVQGVAVELDNTEAGILKATYPGIICLPCALGETQAVRTLYVTSFPECTSFLEPDLEALSDYPVKSYFNVVKTIELETIPFSLLVAEGHTPCPTFVKLDVQGFEREVLKGFGNALDGCIALKMEGHFRPIYKDQWTVNDMIWYMREHDFILRDIRQQGPFEGELVEANFFFTKRAKLLDTQQRLHLKLWETAEQIRPQPAYRQFPSDN